MDNDWSSMDPVSDRLVNDPVWSKDMASQTGPLVSRLGAPGRH
jgi:hypothetical protein